MACPNLNPATNLCQIYNQRFEKNIPYTYSGTMVKNNKLYFINFKCGSIEDEVLGQGILPPETEKKCCYKKPSLLRVIP